VTATNTIPVDSSNTGQYQAWDGDEGAYWAAHAEHFDRAVTHHHERLFAAAGLGPAEHVLDIGCGTGQTTRDAARIATAGSALGVDLSAAMLAHARRRADEEGITNVQFEQADAQVHAFDPAAFDIAISRTGAMFFGDLDAAFANIARAVRAGGRLALTTWQPLSGNEWVREFTGALAAGRDLPAPPAGAPGPFALSDPSRVRDVLGRAGFTGIELDGASTGMWFGADADDAYRFVLGLLGWMLEGLDDAGRARALDDLRATIAAHQTGDGVIYDSAFWIIRATRP
jgi:SAM-dependent methyltransferase